MKPISYCFTSFLYMSFLIFVDAANLPTVSNLRPCTFSDVPCVTRAINVLYPTFVAGNPGVANSSDPLELSNVKVNTTNLQYIGQNGVLTGLIACVVRKLALISENGTYEFVIVCPRLTIEVSNSATNARIKSKQIVGVGSAKITYVDNILTFRGYYSSFFDKEYQLYHRIETFVLTLTTKRVFFNLPALLYGDQYRIGDYKIISQEDLKAYGETLSEELMKSFMSEFQKNYNNMLATKSVGSTYFG